MAAGVQAAGVQAAFGVRGQFPQRPLAAAIGGYSSAGNKPGNDDAITGHLPAGSYEMHTKGVVACIADGISGSRNSHIAAQTSVIQFTQDYLSAPESWTVQESAGRILEALNRSLHAANLTGSPESQGQVTTFTALIARSTTAHVVHIGDTRCLLWREGRLTRLTEDHSATFMGKGEVLTRALGVETHIRVDYLSQPLREGDLYLLLSDGVHAWLGSHAMQEILDESGVESKDALEALSRRICDAALAAGSDDNVSCMAMSVLELPSETLTEAHRRLTDRVIPPVLKPGHRLDGYIVEEVLHSSTRSHVYRVHHESEAELSLILKAPSQNFAEDLHYLEGFILEQWVGRRISNDQVMKVLPAGESQFLYFVAERIEGETLRAWMERHPEPSLDTILPVIGSMISAVRVFHRMGMVHRDLKPENVIVDAGGTCRIIDFGSVQVSGFADVPTAAGEALPEGTLNYIAPEVLLGGSASPASDLFSIGVIVHEMLAGQLPFRLSDRASLPKTLSFWQYRGLGEARPDLAPAVGETLAGCLDPDPEARPAAMSEFLGGLQNAARMAPSHRPFVPLLERGSRRLWQLLFLVTSLIAVALAILLATG